MAFDEQKSEFSQIGRRANRPDGMDKVTGRARYGADAYATGMLHGAIVRSPHAHAKILKIDTTKAMALDGVKAVVTQIVSEERDDDDGQDFNDSNCASPRLDQLHKCIYCSPWPKTKAII